MIDILNTTSNTRVNFGNLITNIPAAETQGKEWFVEISGLRIPGCKSYSDNPSGSFIALIGSHGWVEIAVNGGNAQSQLQLEWGSRVQVVLT